MNSKHNRLERKYNPQKEDRRDKVEDLTQAFRNAEDKFSLFEEKMSRMKREIEAFKGYRANEGAPYET